MRWPTRLLSILGVVGVLLALAIALWPMHGNGVAGNAFRPHYGNFGWFAYAPLPAHPTPDQLRTAGVTLPADVVATRRAWAGGLAAAGVAAVGGAAAMMLRRRRRRAST